VVVAEERTPQAEAEAEAGVLPLLVQLAQDKAVVLEAPHKGVLVVIPQAQEELSAVAAVEMEMLLDIKGLTVDMAVAAVAAVVMPVALVLPLEGLQYGVGEEVVEQLRERAQAQRGHPFLEAMVLRVPLTQIQVPQVHNQEAGQVELKVETQEREETVK
jgi:hypothetical protein